MSLTDLNNIKKSIQSYEMKFWSTLKHLLQSYNVKFKNWTSTGDGNLLL